MKNTVIFLRSHGRRPIQALPVLGLEDVQDQPPAGWCSRCGREVYRSGFARCERCRKGTERSLYEVYESL